MNFTNFSAMQIVIANTEQTEKEFFDLPFSIYKNDPDWVCPLNDEFKKVFDPKKNKEFRKGELQKWILQKDGKTIGRIAAFVNPATSRKEKQPTGGCGFFECINDQNGANLLFDTAKNWLAERDMEAMDGPINFGDRNNWWGLLAVKKSTPVHGMNYHAHYYKDLFENYGFKVWFKQITFHRPIIESLSDKYKEKPAKIMADPNFSFRHIDKKNLEKWAEDFRTVYNKAWVKHGSVAEMRKATAVSIMKAMKPIMDPKIIFFGYYKDEPICMWVSVPDLNTIIKDFKGKLNLINKLKLLWRLKTGKCTKMFGVVFGVVPEFQKRGVDAALAQFSEGIIKNKTNYQELEMTWIGDFNPKMLNVARSVGGVEHNIFHTYRYLFDRTLPYERHPIIG